MTEHDAAWQDYLTAAQSLDAVRRAQAGAAAAATRTLSSTRAELAQVRTQLARQRTALATEAARRGGTAPQLAPSPGEREAASALAGEPAAVPEALRRCRELVDATDARLIRGARVSRRWWWPPRWWRRSGTDDQ